MEAFNSCNFNLSRLEQAVGLNTQLVRQLIACSGSRFLSYGKWKCYEYTNQ